MMKLLYWKLLFISSCTYRKLFILFSFCSNFLLCHLLHGSYVSGNVYMEKYSCNFTLTDQLGFAFQLEVDLVLKN